MTLELVQNDTSPVLTYTLSADLTGATAEAHIKRPDKTVFVRPVTLVDAAAGQVSFGFTDGDLALAGLHYVEVQVTYSNTEIQTFFKDGRRRQMFLVTREIG